MRQGGQRKSVPFFCRFLSYYCFSTIFEVLLHKKWNRFPLSPLSQNILNISLYVTNKDNPIRIENPISCIFISVSCFSGFLLIASINKISNFPPSSAGIGSKFVTPNDNDINAIISKNSLIPFVFATTSDIPYWSHHLV